MLPGELELVAPMIDWTPVGAPPLLPVLFITIACGACSGFHCLVGSGTTSKQIAKETDARVVGYGAMLTEGFLATLVIAACAAGIGLGVTRALDQQPGGVNLVVEPNENRESVPISGPVRYATLFSADYFYSFAAIDTTPEISGPFPRLRVSRSRIDEQGMVHHGPENLEILYDGNLGTDLELNGGSIEFLAPGHALTISGPLAFNKQYESWSAAGSLGAKVGAFVEGAANFVASLGIARDIAIALMAVMVASFAATTMDTACRLQRYVIQELSSTFLPRVRRYSCVACGYDLSAHAEAIERSSDRANEGEGVRNELIARSLDRSVASSPITCPECGHEHPAHEVYHHDRDASWKLARPINPFKWLATVHGATLFAVVTALALASIPPAGQSLTIDSAGTGALILWPLFGATNQLLAGFAFIVIVAWLIATKRPKWFAIPPAVIMLIVPASAMTWQAFIGNSDNASWLSAGNWLLVSISVVTLVLEVWLVTETVLRLVKRTPEFLSS